MNLLMTDKTFNESMMLLAANFGFSTSATPEDRAYTALLKTALSAYPDRAVKTAFDRVIRHGKYKPRVADFMEFLEPHVKNPGKAAWAEVLGALHNCGGMNNRFWLTDGATAEAVEAMGGWRHLSTMSFYDLHQKTTADAFEAVFERACSKGLDNRPGRVVGARDRDWRTGDFLPMTEIKPIPASLPALEYSSQAEHREVEAEHAKRQITYEAGRGTPAEVQAKISGLTGAKAMP